MPVSSGGVFSSDWVSSTGDVSDYRGDGLSPSSLISVDSFTFLVYPDSFHLVM
jgi:hypothetical protein